MYFIQNGLSRKIFTNQSKTNVRKKWGTTLNYLNYVDGKA